MKKLLNTLLALFVVATATYAEPVIGLYEDELATDCSINLEPYVPTLLYVTAVWGYGEFEKGVTQAQFALEGLPTNDPSMGLVDVTPIGADTVEGNIWDGYTLTWLESQGTEEQWFVIATVEITTFSATWIVNDQAVFVSGGEGASDPWFAYQFLDPISVFGVTSYLQATQEWPCNYVEVHEESWSSVKVLF